MYTETDDFRIRRAMPSDAPLMASLTHAVHDAMPEDKKDWYLTDPPAYFEEKLKPENGIGMVAERPDGSPAGVFLTTTPGTAPDNLGHDLGFSEEELLHTAVMDSAAVCADSRGRHLQQRMMTAIEEILRERGYRHLLVTVHPDNVYSAGSCERLGYRAVAKKIKYGGMIRIIYRKDIE